MKEYRTDPLGYAQDLIEKGDRYYNVYADDIRNARLHYQLKSDHLSERAAIAGRKGHYIPELHPAVFSRAAKFFNAFLQGDPTLKFSPQVKGNPLIDQGVSRLERWLNNCLEEGGIMPSWFEAMLCAELYPYAPIFQGWDDKWGPQPRYNELTGKLEYQDFVIYSGPFIESVPIENYRGDFKARCQSDMTFHARIKQVSEGYVRAMAKDGYYPLFNESRMDDIRKSDWATKRKDQRIIQGLDDIGDDNIELIEVFCRVYDETIGRETWNIVTFAGSMVLANRPSPYYDMGAPFRLLTSKILPGESSGIPSAQLGNSTQNMINELWNQMLEANEQAVWAPWVYEGEVSSGATWEPMSLWQVENPKSFTKLSAANNHFEFENSIRFAEERNQQNMGAYNTIQPTAVGSRQTLGEYLDKNRDHNDIMAITLNMYADCFCDLAKMALVMGRERLPQWIEIAMFGDSPILSELTVADLASNVTIDAPKVRGVATEEIEIVKWQGIYDKLMLNPIIGPDLLKVHELTRRFLESQDVKDIDRLIGTEQDALALQIRQQEMAMIEAQMAGAGASAGGNNGKG